VIQPDCVLAGAVNEALSAFLAALDRYTLADLVRPRMKLTRLLRIDEPMEPAPA
jgi:Rrf2 family nitric oxide-sensitive transcriptional repressor